MTIREVADAPVRQTVHHDNGQSPLNQGTHNRDSGLRRDYPAQIEDLQIGSGEVHRGSLAETLKGLTANRQLESMRLLGRASDEGKDIQPLSIYGRGRGAAGDAQPRIAQNAQGMPERGLGGGAEPRPGTKEESDFMPSFKDLDKRKIDGDKQTNNSKSEIRDTADGAQLRTGASDSAGRTTVIRDANGTRTEVTDENGKLKARALEFDDGTKVFQTFYKDGSRVSSIVKDGALVGDSHSNGTGYERNRKFDPRTGEVTQTQEIYETRTAAGVGSMTLEYIGARQLSSTVRNTPLASGGIETATDHFNSDGSRSFRTVKTPTSHTWEAYSDNLLTSRGYIDSRGNQISTYPQRNN